MSIVAAWSYGPYHVIESEGGLFSYDGLTYEGNQQPIAVFAAGSAIMAPFTAVGAGAVSVVGAGVAVMAPFRAYGINRGLVNANEGHGFAKMAAFRAAGSGSIVGGNIGYAVMKPFTAVGAGHVIHNIKGNGVATMAPFRGCTYVARGIAYMAPFRAVGTGRVSSYNVELANLTRTPSTIITIELDTCANRHGEQPCYAVGAPCFNTLDTCTYPLAYKQSSKAHHFCLKSTPVDITGEIVRPYLLEVKVAAMEILANESIIINQRADLKFADEPSDDIGIDPYRLDASTRQSISGTESVPVTGSYWRKLMARNRYYKGRKVRIRQGWDSPDSNTLDNYHDEFMGVFDNMAIGTDGTVTVTVKGLLQLTDVEIPRKTDGKLYLPIGPDTDTIQLAPWTGVDDTVVPPESKYKTPTPERPAYIKIDHEIVRYDMMQLDSATGITTFTGLTHGQFNPYGWDMAQGHNAGDAVQQVEVFIGNPLDLQTDLLRAAKINDDDIVLQAFAAVKSEYLPNVIFAGIIDEPTKIKTLLAELREQTNTHIWQDDTQRITVRYMAPLYPWQTYRLITDEANVIMKSGSYTGQEDKRITRASIYYDQAPGAKLEAENFSRVLEYRDADAESSLQYGEVKARKPIYSRWIWSRHGGDDYTLDLAGSLVDLFRNGGAQIQLDLELKDSTLALGEIFEIETKRVVDIHGNPTRTRYMVIKRERIGRGKYRYQALATGLDGRWLCVAQDDFPDNWSDGTEAQKAYGCISDERGYAPDFTDGYKIIRG